jgi:hypothetical protein
MRNCWGGGALGEAISTLPSVPGLRSRRARRVPERRHFSVVDDERDTAALLDTYQSRRGFPDIAERARPIFPIGASSGERSRSRESARRVLRSDAATAVSSGSAGARWMPSGLSLG